MQKVLTILIGLFAALTLLAAEAQKISLSLGSTRTIQLPFVLKEFRILPAGSDRIKVEEMDSHLRIIANAVGDVSLIVNGISGEQRSYTISVKSNLSNVLKKLRNDLDLLTELDISINEDQIVIKGTISDPAHWAHLQKVLPQYAGKCINFATFAPSAETILDLKKRLQEGGFRFAKDGKTSRPGEILINNTKDTIFITGKLYSRESIAQINRIINSAPIFASGLVKKIVDLSLVPTILEVQVAFVSLTDNDDFARTGNINPTAGFNASFLRQWLDGNTRSKTIGFDSQMAGTISMLQTNLVAKVMDQGTVTFANDSPEGGKYKFGGTIKVPVSGTDTGDLKDVTYGYDVQITGGLISDNEVRLTLDLKSESVGNDAHGNYDQKQNSASLTLPMMLEKTYLVAHHKKLTESSSESAFPILGRIPVIKWFFSDSTNEKKMVNVLVLVSTSIQTTTMTPLIPMNSKQVLRDATRSSEELIQKPTSENISKDFQNVIR